MVIPSPSVVMRWRFMLIIVAVVFGVSFILLMFVYVMGWYVGFGVGFFIFLSKSEDFVALFCFRAEFTERL